MVVPARRGSPSEIRSAAATMRSAKASRTEAATRMRSEEEQTWPALTKQPEAVAAAAASRSASSRMMTGPLPPISISSGLPAARAQMILPVTDDPVKATASVPGLATISSPTTAPSPVTRLSTPGGRSAASIATASAAATSEVVGAGVQTIVLPATRPAPRYSTGMLTGKFHGVTTA